MAKVASVKFLFNKIPANFNALRLVRKFRDHGWDIDDEGIIRFLPLGDSDFDWSSSSVENREQIYELIEAKDRSRELIGVVMIFQDKSSGMTLLIHPFLKEINFVLDINRKMINNTDVTDFSWYLEKLINVFLEEDVSLEYLNCEEG